MGSGTIADDLKRGWAKLRGKPDPLERIGSPNSANVTNESSKQQTQFVWALRDVSLSIEQGDIVGVIGRNGAGKSTLLKLLSRVTAPTHGLIKAKGRIASLLEVGTGFHQELTGRENIYLNGAILGMTRQEISKQLDNIIAFSGCDQYIDTPVKRYSSGMVVRLGFSVAAHLQCEVLIVDEVLAVGDHDFQKRCIGKMKEVSDHGRTVIVVSHNMGSVSALCDRCVVMSNGEVSYEGSVDQAIRNYMSENTGEKALLTANPHSDFSFTSIASVDEEGSPVQSFGFQHTVTFHLEFHLCKEIQGLEIGLCISSQQGTTVFWTTRSHALESEINVGTSLVSIEIPAHFLNPGTYFVSIAAHVPNIEMIQQVDSAISFTVEETGSPYFGYMGKDIGLVYCECKWTSLK
ncbi:ABC transporter ATP-binding protein [Neorhodopirellula lusitana]|uniref:ABC transporter ATP-binding protein n=1 Tax=Neorhodopirellula lusitana TaxID=445327 RepID=UPI00384B0CCC